MLYICCLTSFALCLQERANKIQQILEELVKSLNEQCKIYGLRAKPTTLVEFPSSNLVRYLVELGLVVFLV